MMAGLLVVALFLGLVACALAWWEHCRLDELRKATADALHAMASAHGELVKEIERKYFP